MSNIFETAKTVFSYNEFVQHAENLLAQGKTTGANQSEEYLFYAKLNLQRMHRWNKTFVLRNDIVEQLLSIPKQDWWIITEAWCGDSAQNLPAIAKMETASAGKIKLRIVLRDDNPHIMDQYLTNGTSRSIPILVAFDTTTGEQKFKWGPRPYTAQQLLTEWKNAPQPKPFEEFEKEMHTWYTNNKGNALQDEIMTLLQYH